MRRAALLTTLPLVLLSLVHLCCGSGSPSGSDANPTHANDRDASSDEAPQADAAVQADDVASHVDAGEPEGPALPARSAGCGGGAPASGVTRTVTVSGAERSFVLYVPPSYDPNRAYPIVAAFHGIGATGPEMAAFIKMQDYAAGNAIVAFPSAANGTWDVGGESDLKFWDAMVDNISSSYCVNQQRVFALGFSWGAYMVNHVGCNRSNVRAIAPAAGGFPDRSGCGRTAALVYHRTEDNDESVQNGRNARDRWVEINGCSKSSKPATASDLGGLGCVQYDNCARGKPVVWCEDNVSTPYPHDLRDVYRVPIWNWFAQF